MSAPPTLHLFAKFRISHELAESGSAKMATAAATTLCASSDTQTGDVTDAPSTIYHPVYDYGLFLARVAHIPWGPASSFYEFLFNTLFYSIG